MESLGFMTTCIFYTTDLLQLKAFPSGSFKEALLGIFHKVVWGRHNRTVLKDFFEDARAREGKRQGKRKEKGVHAGEGNYTSSLELERI